MVALSDTENGMLMFQARRSLNGHWALAVITFLAYVAIHSLLQFVPGVGWLVSIFIIGPLSLGISIFSLTISRNEIPMFSQLFDGFEHFGMALGAYLLQSLFILLWSLLLIIPGIIAALSYSLTFFIIADNETIGPIDAIAKSKELMIGNKWKLFCLNFRFLGWALLSVLTFGIGFFWLMPYMAVSYANFYDDVIH